VIGTKTLNPYLIEQTERTIHLWSQERLNQHNQRNLAFKPGSNFMRALLAVPIFAIMMISNGMIAEADPLGSATASAAEAQVVHVQPRANDFRPHSPASEAEQRRLSTFDAEQQKSDATLDKKLSICRC